MLLAPFSLNQITIMNFFLFIFVNVGFANRTRDAPSFSEFSKRTRGFMFGNFLTQQGILTALRGILTGILDGLDEVE
jgi:hypothetical protein